MYSILLLQLVFSLYGHKLPVLCLEMSGDSALVVTGSQDKNVHIWGLDFGNVHKRIFAHDGRLAFICLSHLLRPKKNVTFL